MSSTDLDVRRTLDMTRAPTEQWNEEMMALVAATVLKRASTRGEQIYCLAVADALALNPFIDEIYFLPTKSTDGSGPGIKPYIGRNGLVKKAAERGAYFESETVHENDRFRVTRKANGEVTVTHSYGATDRGPIIGAYAFLHGPQWEHPSFFYAKLEEYLPTFDAEWKMSKSPWGNQRSAMIEKCAMIGAGRKRLDLGNVLMDGEIARFEQMQQAGPAPLAVEAPQEFDWEALPAGPQTIGRLRAAASALDWTPAKAELVLRGLDQTELAAKADELEAQAQAAQSGSGDAAAADDLSPAEGSGSAAAAGSDDEGVADAEVVPDAEHAAALERRIADLEERMAIAAPESDEFAMLSEELDAVQAELEAVRNPDQGSLL